MRALVLALLLAALPLAQALPTPGANGELTQKTLGRIFPEALQTNDFVGYDEAVSGLKLLEAQAPDLVELVPLGPSRGWVDLVTGQRVGTDLFAVEVTNEKSPVPPERKLTLVFFLSIHGNEKGGREGGLRAIEDLALGLGLAQEEPDLVEMLDYQKLVFVFANTDGWTREEVRHRTQDVGQGSPTTTTAPNFARENGNFTDLNRQFPTVGYLDPRYLTMNEPEARAMVAYTKGLTNVVAGADIHGMMENTNLVRILLKDGEKSQPRLLENARLAQLYKQRLNENPAYDGWAAAPERKGVCCGQVAEWAATFDAIGYSASGTAGAWIVQRQGLDAPGYTVEFAYNHLAFDNYYPGPGALFNHWHVEAVRDIVSVFMRFAAESVDLRVETGGRSTLVLRTPYLATNEDDDRAAYEGWFVENPHDDAFDVANRAFRASPNAYWEDLRRFARQGESPGVVDLVEEPSAFLARLPDYANAVVPGSAAGGLLAEPGAGAALQAYVEAGGNLVLTDSALRLLEPMGLVPPGRVGEKQAYSGYTDLVDPTHPLVANLEGWPRQTYDPNPLGFGPGASPVWFVDRAAWEAAGGATVGAVGKEGSGTAVVEDPAACGDGGPMIPRWMQRPDHDHFGEALDLAPLRAPLVVPAPADAAFGPGMDCQELDATNVGVLARGAGTVHVFGAILPDPSEDASHPYGLDNHAVATNGNLVLLNMMGARFDFTTQPSLEAKGIAKLMRGEVEDEAAPAGEDAKAVPLPALVAPGALAAAGLARRRR